MRLFLALLVMALQIGHARERAGDHDPLMVKALTGIERRLGVEFVIPFPSNFDIDVYLKQPLAILSVDGGKVCATRPTLNPFDEPLLLEWMIGPPDPLELAGNDVSFRVSFDRKGELERIGMLVDWASDGTGNHQLERRKGESGLDFLRRAMETYRMRAQSAKDPDQAAIFLKAFGKMVSVIRALRQEEALDVAD